LVSEAALPQLVARATGAGDAAAATAAEES
jgi:hypothetical protein